jgi:hypothetical protein
MLVGCKLQYESLFSGLPTVIINLYVHVCACSGSQREGQRYRDDGITNMPISADPR